MRNDMYYTKDHIWIKPLHEQIKWARKFWEYGASRVAWAIYTDHLGLGCKDGTENDYLDLQKLLENNYLIADMVNGETQYHINSDLFNYENDFYTKNFE